MGATLSLKLNASIGQAEVGMMHMSPFLLTNSWSRVISCARNLTIIQVVSELIRFLVLQDLLVSIVASMIPCLIEVGPRGRRSSYAKRKLLQRHDQELIQVKFLVVSNDGYASQSQLIQGEDCTANQSQAPERRVVLQLASQTPFSVQRGLLMPC